MEPRRLGRSDITVGAIGLGCWAIGGPFDRTDGSNRGPMGWGKVDDAESIRAIHRGLDMGVTLFDTANNYGAGHSERVLGQALAGSRRDRAVVATKFGSIFDEQSRTHFDGQRIEPSERAVEDACDASLKRLGVDHIDLYQFHCGDYDVDQAVVIRDSLEGLVAKGKIRWYGWSTDDPVRARIFAQGSHCAAVQHALNIFSDAPEMLALCEEFDLASINKSPLRSGFLTAKYKPSSTFPEDDERHGADLSAAGPSQRLAMIDELRQAFSERGRTPAQIALGWNLARSPRTIPIPGFKSVAQVEDNAGTMALGPLTPDEMAEVNRVVAS